MLYTLDPIAHHLVCFEWRLYPIYTRSRPRCPFQIPFRYSAVNSRWTRFGLITHYSIPYITNRETFKSPFPPLVRHLLTISSFFQIRKHCSLRRIAEETNFLVLLGLCVTSQLRSNFCASLGDYREFVQRTALSSQKSDAVILHSAVPNV